MRTKGSDLLVAALENEDVQRIFGLPREENLDVVESLRKSRIELVLTRHEQAASFMAATQGRLTGSPGICLSTLGPEEGIVRLDKGMYKIWVCTQLSHHRRQYVAARQRAGDHGRRSSFRHSG
jgi:thiamine pyrophosphate-dependent acetolactate synthase large subunit-like protein